MWLSVLSSSLIPVFLVIFNSRCVCGQLSDSCDWVGSGLLQDVGESPGVRPLYLRCAQGRIRWHYPRGGLRVLLRPPLSNFRGCVRLAGQSTGARLFLEGRGKLFPLFKQGEEEGRTRCFSSRMGQAALYVEADTPLNILRRDVVEFAYDLMPAQNLADDMEECRPCTDEEILESYCTSDFVIQGVVSALTHNSTTETSELTIRVKYVHIDNAHQSWSKYKYVTLHRPLKCGTKSGQGEFLFLGRWRLGNPVVHCAPRLSHWKEIKRKAIDTNSNLCQLD